MDDSEKIPFSTGTSTEQEFVDRFQVGNVYENQRCMINSRFLFVCFCRVVILQEVVG